MNRQDQREIADAIGKTAAMFSDDSPGSAGARVALRECASRIANYMESADPVFKRERWLDSCIEAEARAAAGEPLRSAAQERAA